MDYEEEVSWIVEGIQSATTNKFHFCSPAQCASWIETIDEELGDLTDNTGGLRDEVSGVQLKLMILKTWMRFASGQEAAKLAEDAWLTVEAFLSFGNRPDFHSHLEWQHAFVAASTKWLKKSYDASASGTSKTCREIAFDLLRIANIVWGSDAPPPGSYPVESVVQMFASYDLLNEGVELFRPFVKEYPPVGNWESSVSDFMFVIAKLQFLQNDLIATIETCIDLEDRASDSFDPMFSYWHVSFFVAQRAKALIKLKQFERAKVQFEKLLSEELSSCTSKEMIAWAREELKELDGPN